MLNAELQKVIDLLPVMKQIFERDVYLTIMDADGKIQGFSLPDGVKPQLRVGEPFQDPTGAVYEVIRTGTRKHNYLPKDVMGEALEGVMVPIWDETEVVGCIICTYSVDEKERMVETAEKFQNSIHSINASIHNVVDGIESLFTMLTDMTEMTKGVDTDVQNAVKIVHKISGNASRSNILALNASIEAARSGEHGRGFAVVATEMGKLANDSGSSASEIQSTLNTITEHLESIVSSIKGANGVAKEHMESVSSIQGILEETLSLAQKLEDDIKNR